MNYAIHLFFSYICELNIETLTPNNYHLMKKLLLSILTVVCSLGFIKAQEAAENVQVLIDTDFTVFTEGSEASPKTLTSISFNSKAEGYYQISGISAAGGKILVGPSGYLTLKPFTDLPTAGGTIRVTMDVKMLDSYGGAIQFIRGYSSSDIVNALVESDDWTTVTVYAGGFTNTSSSRLKVQPSLSVNGMYVKRIKVEYSPDFISAPEAYLPGDADGTQFTASCSRVSGASKYEADVFSIGSDDKPVYFAQDVELKALSAYSDPSAKITGLDPATTYYYVARAVNANGKKSEDSEPVEVIKKITSIAAPEAYAASGINEGGFTASWSAVADAKYYIVNTYEKQTLTEDAEAAVFAEDFSGVNFGSISTIAYDGNLNDYTKVQGWITDFSKAFAAGYYVMYPSTGPGNLTTPEIDLSANGGKFSVVLTGFTGAFGNIKATENTIGAELLEGDQVTETSATLKCDKTGTSDFIFNFTKGTAASRIRFVYTQAENDANKLYIDEIKVNQLMPAGTVVSNIIDNQSVTGTSTEVKLTPTEGKEYSYGVIAVGLTVSGYGSNASVGEIMSAVSNLVDVDFSSLGIDDIATELAPKAWKAADGAIGVNGCNVAMYDMMGRTIHREMLPAGNRIISLGKRGVVIVTVDGSTYKIAL